MITELIDKLNKYTEYYCFIREAGPEGIVIEFVDKITEEVKHAVLVTSDRLKKGNAEALFNEIINILITKK